MDIHNSSMDFVHDLEFLFLQFIISDEITNPFLHLNQSTTQYLHM